MADIQSDQPISQRDLRSVVIGVKFMALPFMLLALLLTYPFVDTIPTYRGIYSDMLPGKPLPPLTEFVIQSQQLMRIAMFLAPLVGVICLFSIPKHSISFLAAAICGTIQVLTLVTLFWALILPLVSIFVGINHQ